MKSTKKSLVGSALVLLLCLVMLVGTTFAWFTDSVTNGGNIIKAGKLDIDLLVKDTWGGEYKSVKESKEAIFDHDKWEPGYTDVKYIKVVTTGNLALKYTLSITPYDAVEAGDLAEVIDVYYAPEPVQVTGRDTSKLKKLGTLKDVFDGAENTVISDTLIPEPKDGDTADTEDFATIVLKMQETAGNEYQGLSVGGGFDLRLLATQYTYEEDSFDDQYDADAKYPVVDAESLKTTLVDGGVINLGASFNMMNENTVAGRNQINADTVLNLNNETLTFRNAATNDDLTNISAIYAENFDLTLNAENGGIDSDFYGINVGDTSNAATVQPTVTINGGKYKAGSVVNVESGTVYITGGFFDGRDVYGDGENATYLLNCIDRCYKAGDAKIVVTGGTFVNFNPANNSAEGAGTNFVPEGYTVQTTKDGANTLYTVVA